MTDIQSQYTIFLTRFGTVRFESDPNTYNRQKVIDYAEQNGWVYKSSVLVRSEDLTRFEKRNFLDSDPIGEVLFHIKAYNSSPFWIKSHSELMAFDTGSGLGTASFVMLSGDGAEMVVRYSDPALPDGPHGFWLPPCFEEAAAKYQQNAE